MERPIIQAMRALAFALGLGLVCCLVLAPGAPFPGVAFVGGALADEEGDWSLGDMDVDLALLAVSSAEGYAELAAMLEEVGEVLGSPRALQRIEQKLDAPDLNDADRTVLRLLRSASIDLASLDAKTTADRLCVRLIAIAATVADTPEQIEAVLEQYSEFAEEINESVVRDALPAEGDAWSPPALARMVGLARDWPALGAAEAARRFADRDVDSTGAEPLEEPDGDDPSPDIGDAAPSSRTAPDSSGGGAPTALSAGGDTRFAGLWKGRLTDNNGEAFDYTFRFSDAGNPVWGYTGRNISENVELTHAGQRIQYVPPGGGVKTIVFEEIHASAEVVTFMARATFERASGGYMVSEEEYLAFDFRFVEGRLALTFTISSQKISSQFSGVGDGSVFRAEGLLDRSQ